MAAANEQVVLAKRPGKCNAPTAACFRTEPCPMPALEADTVIIRTTMLSVDPALRCRLNEESGVEYVKAFEVDRPVDGFGGVGVVHQVGANCSDKLAVGDIVTNANTLWPWRTYFSAKPEELSKVQLPPGHDETVVLSCLGLIGLTVSLGFQEKGHIDATKKQTVVISGAAGACGVLAGQIARLLGAHRVVGIAGSDEKCKFLTEQIGYDAAVNYKCSPEALAEALGEKCPDGVHCYFDNVGGDVSEAVVSKAGQWFKLDLGLMVANSHVILCGQISQYNSDVPYPPPISPAMQQTIEKNAITRERYLVLNYSSKFSDALAQLFGWLAAGKLKVHCTVSNGLDNAGAAFCDMMNGKNTGKQIVKL